MIVPIRIARSLVRVARKTGSTIATVGDSLIVCSETGKFPVLATYGAPLIRFIDGIVRVPKNETWQSWAKAKTDWKLSVDEDFVHNGILSSPRSMSFRIYDQDWDAVSENHVDGSVIAASLARIAGALDDLPVILDGGEFLATDRSKVVIAPSGVIRRGFATLPSGKFVPTMVENAAIIASAAAKMPATWTWNDTENGAILRIQENGSLNTLQVFLGYWPAHDTRTISADRIRGFASEQGTTVRIPRWYLSVARLFEKVALYENGEIFCFSPENPQSGIACTGSIPTDLPVWIGSSAMLRKLCDRQKGEFLTLLANGPPNNIRKNEDLETIARHKILNLNGAAIAGASARIPDVVAEFKSGMVLWRNTA